MAEYKEQSDPAIIEDLHGRKEYARLWVPPDVDFRNPKNARLPRKQYDPKPHQLFVNTFMNPSTTNMRMHLMHSTGCHAPGTPIMLANGAEVPVETLAVGCRIAGIGRLGDAATPTTIAELHAGIADMWIIRPRPPFYALSYRDGKISPVEKMAGINAREYCVNGGHILHLARRFSQTGVGGYENISVAKAIARGPSAASLVYMTKSGEFYLADYSLEFSHRGRYVGFTLASTTGLFLGVDGLILHNSGKCLADGTRVRLFGGGTIAVESVRNDTLLVGDDLRPRGIVGRMSGIDDCFEVRADGCAPYVCNSSHILTVSNLCCDVMDVPILRAIEMLEAGEILHAVRVDGAKRAAISISHAGRRKYSGFEVTGNGRFLLADGTVTHNSRAAIGIAQKCVAVYRKIYSDVDFRRNSIITPQVFVVAFAGKRAFINDLLSDPEFGYVTAEERAEFEKLRANRSHDVVAGENYAFRYTRLVQRLKLREQGGFYQFVGYDEFVNILFGNTASEIPAIIDGADDPHAAVAAAVASGALKINSEFMERMRGSLIICDEIHNAYNTQSVNNRGIALQYVLDHAPDLRFLSLSATPINGNPAEIVDLINLLTPPRVGAAGEILPHYKRADFFSGRVPCPHAMEEIADIVRGRISTLYDLDLTNFPRKYHDGLPLYVQDGSGEYQEQPYLRFTPCEMSDDFMAALRDFVMKKDAEAGAAGAASAASAAGAAGAASAIEFGGALDDDDAIIGISQGHYPLFDMVFPNPDGGVPLYNWTSLGGIIHNAPQEWKTREEITTHLAGDVRIIGGGFLAADKLRKWSAKYATLISELEAAITKTGACKILIFHERVRSTGIFLVGEILRMNGVIDYGAGINDDTRCAACFKQRRVHGRDESDARGRHEFAPLRFAAVYSEQDKRVSDSIITNFQSRENARGEWCSILLGSKVLRESVELPAVRHLFVLSLPVSIPQLTQVFGRCVRHGSHASLPPAERDVHIHILLHVPPGSIREDRIAVPNIFAPEVRKYALKLSAYVAIQHVERELARMSVDAGINRNAMTLQREDQIGLLYYDEPIKFSLRAANGNQKPLAVDTFFAYGYGQQEIQLVVDIIKRLFVVKNAWRLDELLAAVRSPPFGVNVNPELFDEKSISIALAYLLSVGDAIVAGSSSARSVTYAGIECRIISSGEYLFLAPITSVTVAGVVRHGTIIDIEAHLRESARLVLSERTVSIDKYELSATFEESVLGTLRLKYKPAVMAAVMSKRGKAAVAAMLGVRGFLLEFSADQQRVVARKMVESREFREEFSALYSLMLSLGVLILKSRVANYREVVKHIENPDSIAADDPVAVGDSTAIHLYTGRVWNDINHASLNMHMEYDEDEPIVGIYEQFKYEMKFKVRDPIHKLREERGHDARNIKRGIACMTMPRARIVETMRKLGIAEPKKGGAVVHDMCDEIQKELLKKEFGFRSDHRSLDKCVYGWWNIIPSAN